MVGVSLLPLATGPKDVVDILLVLIDTSNIPSFLPLSLNDPNHFFTFFAYLITESLLLLKTTAF